MLARLDENLELGIFRVVAVDWTRVHEKAGQLARTHTPKSGARGFDLLHVATADVLKASAFLSMDGPQRKVVRACGLSARKLRVSNTISRILRDYRDSFPADSRDPAPLCGPRLSPPGAGAGAHGSLCSDGGPPRSGGRTGARRLGQGGRGGAHRRLFPF